MEDGHKPPRRVKCEGRFSELRGHLYETVLPLVLEDRKVVTRSDLKNAWGFVQEDIYQFDIRDPYYHNTADSLRRTPSLDYLSLVPLIESPANHLEEGLYREYTLSMGNDIKISDYLQCMQKNPSDFFGICLKRTLKNIVLPSGINLTGYVVSGNCGLGTTSLGGAKGGGIRSDSPFLLEMYTHQNHQESNLVAVAGFWAQDNALLVSQMQPCRNAHFPPNVLLGVALLHIAEVAAERMGFERIISYSARNHPIFKEHPDSRSQLEAEFVCLWDNSASKLNFEGSRHSNHSKILTKTR
ncbi:MAG: hypothetical protein FJY98_01745 [Candidatus Liptonbacteria bacterium]|nr:hypothetical protein [Candidatus Pacearchaeota archaeon]MBM3257031.1 hypothetical protein [Candidatus Liptonbacteria bacterium]